MRESVTGDRVTREPVTRSPFFLVMSVSALLVALAGFSTTLFLPLARGTFRAPVAVNVHGALFFGWVLLLVMQSWLVSQRRVATHRTIGWAGAAIAGGMMVSGVIVGFWATRRDVAAGGGDFAVGQLPNIIIEMLLFGALVGGAIVMRRKREWHKRLMLLATISVLGPAWLRFRHFLPGIENPFVVFSLVADAIVLVAVAHDLITQRRVHPAYYIVGTIMVAIHFVELFAITSPPWLAAGRWLLR